MNTAGFYQTATRSCSGYLPGHVLRAFCAAAVLCAFCLSAHQAGAAVVERSRFLMGTIVTIRIETGSGIENGHAAASAERALDEVARIEEVFTVYRSTSEVSRINGLRAHETLKVSDEVFSLIETAIDFSGRTEGAFDITVKPLVDLWRHAADAKRLPGPGEIDDALARTGSRHIILDRSSKTVSFDRDGMAIDMGGIAKGYAADRAVSVLREEGIRSAIVSCGGSTWCLGSKNGRDPWNAGIRHPRDRSALFMELGLKDKAIDTSGDYERFFMLDGKRYAHIIDPRTGSPIGDTVVSASVIADNALTADIMATALSILGTDGFDELREIAGTDAVIVIKKGDSLRIETTPGFADRYRIRHGDTLQ